MKKFLDTTVSDEFLLDTPVRKMGSPSGQKIILVPGDHCTEEVETPIVEFSRFVKTQPGSFKPFRDDHA